MSARGRTQPHQRLSLRAGEWVEVRSLSEILETLDDQGRLDALPFMPEMVRWCGRRLRVLKSAHKTCDRVEKSGLRRMEDAVHLDEPRCDGSAHGGCQAGCLIFWKEAWLKRAEPPGADLSSVAEQRTGSASEVPPLLAAATRSSGDIPVDRTLSVEDRVRLQTPLTEGPDATPGSIRWSCQATEMLRATTPLKWWDPRHYVLDVRRGNATLGAVVRWLIIRSLNQVQRIPRTYRIVEAVRGPYRYPRVEGSLKKTPRATLNLSPGERVRVRSTDEIRGTLDTRARNRGLSFDMEMVRYCGGTYTVLGRVTRLIDEPTGRMMEPPNDCIILDKVVCKADYHGLCPRAIYPYWREIWLERAEAEATASRTTMVSGTDRVRITQPARTAAGEPASARGRAWASSEGKGNESTLPAAADTSCGQETVQEDECAGA